MKYIQVRIRAFMLLVFIALPSPTMAGDRSPVFAFMVDNSPSVYDYGGLQRRWFEIAVDRILRDSDVQKTLKRCKPMLSFILWNHKAVVLAEVKVKTLNDIVSFHRNMKAGWPNSGTGNTDPTAPLQRAQMKYPRRAVIALLFLDTYNEPTIRDLKLNIEMFNQHPGNIRILYGRGGRFFEQISRNPAIHVHPYKDYMSAVRKIFKRACSVPIS